MIVSCTLLFTSALVGLAEGKCIIHSNAYSIKHSTFMSQADGRNAASRDTSFEDVLC